MSKYNLQDYLDSIEEELNQNSKRQGELKYDTLTPLLQEAENLMISTRKALQESPEELYAMIYEAYEEKSLNIEASLQASLKELHG